jgi:RND family efflux transporter MFP subunit
MSLCAISLRGKVRGTILLAFWLAVGTHLAAAAPASDEPSVLVTITKLRPGSVPHTVSAYGTVQADPSAREAVMAPASASVTRIYVRVGEEVTKGAPLIQLVPNPQSQATFAAARSALRAANAQLQHTHELLSQYLATKQQLVDAEKAQSDARAALSALQMQGAGGPKTLTAAVHATITKIDANVGMLVTEGTALLELAPPSSLVLKVGVVPADAGAIRPGNQVTITALGRAAPLKASVLLRGAVVDPSDGLVPIEIMLPANTLMPGETARAIIATDTVQGYIAPHAAILINDSGQPYVVQLKAMKAKLVPVKVLAANSGQDVIAGELDPSAPVILSGAHQLSEGMRVRLSDSKRSAP